MLREWGLPAPGDSKKSRGEIVIVGGARSSPGAVILAGEAALRVGAGRVALAVPGSIDAHVGIALPEAGIYALPDDADAAAGGAAGEHLGSADAVLIGPGFDDPAETRATVLAVAGTGPARLVLDAFAVGVLPDVERSALPGTVILSANKEEAAILLVGLSPAPTTIPRISSRSRDGSTPSSAATGSPRTRTGARGGSMRVVRDSGRPAAAMCARAPSPASPLAEWSPKGLRSGARGPTPERGRGSPSASASAFLRASSRRSSHRR